MTIIEVPKYVILGPPCYWSLPTRRRRRNVSLLLLTTYKLEVGIMQEVASLLNQLLSVPRPFRLTLSDVTGRSSLHARFVLCSLHNGSYLIGPGDVLQQ